MWAYTTRARAWGRGGRGEGEEGRGRAKRGGWQGGAGAGLRKEQGWFSLHPYAALLPSPMHPSSPALCTSPPQRYAPILPMDSRLDRHLK